MTSMAAKFHSFFLGLTYSVFKQSKAVGRKWWGQSSGKGKRTATVLRADFKAALAKTTADAAAASEGEL